MIHLIMILTMAAEGEGELVPFGTGGSTIMVIIVGGWIASSDDGIGVVGGVVGTPSLVFPSLRRLSVIEKMSSVPGTTNSRRRVNACS